MAGLPAGWEWDYDGTRWLYRYKPNGHVQYHFPKAGDEFPDYIDVSAPAPDLAPEERLESRQQVRRQASTNGEGGGAAATGSKKKKKKDKDKDGWRMRMSATAQPISSVWEDNPEPDEDEDEEGKEEDVAAEGVFRPESFMFLGPGTYTDVSPLVEEEEEAAKRTVVGIQEVKGSNLKSVSPMVSVNTTPMAQKSEMATACAGDGGGGGGEADGQEQTTTIIMGESVIEAPPVVIQGEPVMVQIESAGTAAQPPPPPPPVMEGGNGAAIDGGFCHQMQMYHELPVETAVPMQQQQQQQPFDPVGVVAEMPTEHTAQARIETHPDPVEMADNSVLAPIETAVLAMGVAELPERTSPVERRVSGLAALRDQQQQQQHKSTPETTMEVPEETQTSSIVVKPTTDSANQGLDPAAGASQGAVYQPYVPGQAPSQAPTESFSSRIRSISLQREASLMMSLKQANPSTTIDRELVLASLSPPQVPPMKPPPSSNNAGEPTSPEDGTASPAFGKKTEDGEAKVRDQGLLYIPSVLKPAGNGPHRNSIKGLSPSPVAPNYHGPTAQGQVVPQQQPQQASTGVSKFPSVLRPARGKPGQQKQQPPPSPVAPNQVLPSQPGMEAEVPRRGSQGYGYVPVSHSQHPPSMTPAPKATAPDHPPFWQRQPPRPQAYIPPQQPALPVAHANGGPQQLIPGRQFTSTPYPCDDAPPMGPLHGQQSARRASAMPVLSHERQASAPGWMRQMLGKDVSGYGSAITAFRPPSAQQLQQQQQRRQSYQPAGSQHQFPQIPKPQQPRPQSMLANPSPCPGISASYSSPSPPAQLVQHRSSFAPDEVSPIRARSESQSSVLTMQTPSPMEQFRRGSSSQSLSQALNGSYFSPTPESQSSSSPGRDATPPPAAASPPLSPPSTPPLQSTGQGPQRPPVPSKIPLSGNEAASAANSPPQNFGSQASVAAPSQGKDVSKRHSMPAHQLAAMMKQNPPGQAFPAASFQAPGAVGQRSGDLQRSQSLRQSRASRQTPAPLDNNNKSAQHQGPQPPPGPPLGLIEENDENDAALGSNLPPRPNKESSVMRVLEMQQPSHGVKQLPVPPPIAPPPSEFQGTVPHGGPKTQLVLSQMPPSHHYMVQGQISPPQNTVTQRQTLQGGAQPPPVGLLLPQGQSAQQPVFIPIQGPRIHQSSSVQPLTLPPQGFQPRQSLQQQQKQQQPWNPQTNTNGPSALRPDHIPPLQTPNRSGAKEKGKVWSKWFKGGSKSSAKSPTSQVQPNYPLMGQPAAVSGPNQSFSTYGGGDYHQSADWQPMQPLQHMVGPPAQSFQQPEIHQQAAPASLIVGQEPQGMSSPMRPNTSDSVSILTMSSDAAQSQGQQCESVAQHPCVQTSGEAPAAATGGSVAIAHQPAKTMQFVEHRLPAQDLKPAPLFSKAPLPENSEVVRNAATVERREESVPVSKQNKWANKPAADYSGGDWGGEFA